MQQAYFATGEELPLGITYALPLLRTRSTDDEDMTAKLRKMLSSKVEMGNEESLGVHLSNRQLNLIIGRNNDR